MSSTWRILEDHGRFAAEFGDLDLASEVSSTSCCESRRVTSQRAHTHTDTETETITDTDTDTSTDTHTHTTHNTHTHSPTQT